MGGGQAYLAIWLDLYSRRIVGWCVDDNMEDALILVPLRTALQRRQPATRLVVHSDWGGQYTSNEVQKLVSLWRIRPGMSRADDPYDNAFSEPFWSGLKAELLEGGCFLSADDARTEVFEYIECCYNRVRKHPSLGYRSPEHVDNEYRTKIVSCVCR